MFENLPRIDTKFLTVKNGRGCLSLQSNYGEREYNEQMVQWNKHQFILYNNKTNVGVLFTLHISNVDAAIVICFKAAVLDAQKIRKWKNNKINGKYWSSYVQWRNLLYWPLNSVNEIVGKPSCFFCCINYCVTNAVAVMYSRNILMAEKQIVCFKAKKSKYVSFCDF